MQTLLELHCVPRWPRPPLSTRGAFPLLRKVIRLSQGTLEEEEEEEEEEGEEK